MTIEDIEQELKRLESRIKSLESSESNITKTLNSNTRMLERIDRAITGEPESGADGLVKKQQIIENRTEKLEDFKNKWVYWIMGASAGGSAIVLALSELIDKILQ